MFFGRFQVEADAFHQDHTLLEELLIRERAIHESFEGKSDIPSNTHGISGPASGNHSSRKL